jgi:hypothetical protein
MDQDARTSHPLRALSSTNNELVKSLGISIRTLMRWRKNPPKLIEGLVKTAAGRDLMRWWIAQAEATQETQQAA